MTKATIQYLPGSIGNSTVERHSDDTEGEFTIAVNDVEIIEINGYGSQVDSGELIVMVVKEMDR